MKLDFIELCGFRGFREKLRVDLAPGFTVFTGRNGVGKSTLCDAIEFAIRGKIDKYRVEKSGQESISDYIWWRGAGHPEAFFVTIGFRHDDGSTFAIHRTREQGANHSVAQIEEMLCSPGAKPDKAIEQICRTTIIRDELIAALSLDLTETERFELVRAALGAISGPDYAEKARSVCALADRTSADAERTYEAARAEFNRSLSEIAELREAAYQADDISVALANVRDTGGVSDGDLTGKISASRQNLASYRMRLNEWARLVDIAREVGTARALVHSSKFQAGLEETRASISTAQREVAQAEAVLEDARRRHETERGADVMAASLSMLVEHGAHLGLHEGRCPLCEAERTVPEFEAGLSRARARLDALGSEVARARHTMALANEAHAAASARLQNAQRDLARLDSDIDDLANQETGLSQQLERSELPPALGGDPTAFEEFVRAERSRLIDLERSVLTLETSQAVVRVTELEARLETMRGTVDTSADRLAKAQSAAATAKSLERAVKRTNAEMVDERLSIISPLLNDLYQRLRPHSEWRNIAYHIRGDVKRFLSLTVGSDLNPQFLFSSGQRRAAGLAFLLSVHLSRPWCNWRTLVLDDPVQHIDDFRALHLVEILSSLCRSGRQIVCAVEDAALADLLCRRLSTSPVEAGRRFDLDFAADGVAFTAKPTEIPPLPEGVLGAGRLSLAG